MKLGAVFPQTEIGSDPDAVKAFAQAAESLGYEYILAYDHVLGADTANRPEWRGGYRLEHAFHEPFVLFSYLAGVTERIQLATGVIILPQRQTALVAKQAAALDVLSGGRLRLGVGVGWNAVEYEALGQDFRTRGRRYEEQVEVLRLLWTQESVTFEGRWHSVPAAGINPLPVQRPIPIWMGGASGMGNDERVLRRIARLADGWILNQRAEGTAREDIARFREAVRDQGRDPASVGVDGRVPLDSANAIDQAARALETWINLGADYAALNTMNAGLTTPDAHIDALRRFKEAVG